MAKHPEYAAPRLDTGTAAGGPPGSGKPAGALVKAIRWNGSAWECEPLTVRVYLPVGDTQQEIPIDPKDIVLTDERKWLRLTGVTAQGKRSVVSVGLVDGVRILPETAVVIAPQGSRPRQLPVCAVVAAVPAPKAPSQVPEDKCLLTVKVAPPDGSMPDSLAAGTAALAPAGAPPGWAPDKIILTCEIIYRVEPPTVLWQTVTGQTLRLDGKAWSPAAAETDSDPAAAALQPAQPEAPEADIEALEAALAYPSGVFKLQTAPLPPGWTADVSIDAALSEAARNLQLSIVLFQGAGGGEDVLTAYVKLNSGLLCLLWRNQLDDLTSTQPNVFPELALATASPSLGRQVARHVVLPAQALETSLYCCSLPTERHQWGSAALRQVTRENAVLVVPDDKTAAPPDGCRLALHLRLLNGWPDPGVAWSLTGAAPHIDEAASRPVLNDAIAPARGPKVVYRAPGCQAWKTGGAPDRRTIVCLVNAPDGKVRPIPGHQDLYSALVIEADIGLAEGTRRVRLKIRLSPVVGKTDTISPHGNDKAATDPFVRQFTIDIDFT